MVICAHFKNLYIINGGKFWDNGKKKEKKSIIPRCLNSAIFKYYFWHILILVILSKQFENDNFFSSQNVSPLCIHVYNQNNIFPFRCYIFHLLNNVQCKVIKPWTIFSWQTSKTNIGTISSLNALSTFNSKQIKLGIMK